MASIPEYGMNMDSKRYGGDCADLFFTFHMRDDATGMGLPGASFLLRDRDYGSEHVSVSDEQGFVSFPVLPRHWYILTEQEPPHGYDANHALYSVCVDALGNVSVDDHDGETGSYVDAYSPYAAGFAQDTAAPPPDDLDAPEPWRDGAGTAYRPGTETPGAQDSVPFTDWAPADSFSVTYDANGGSGAFVDGNLPYAAEYGVAQADEIDIYRMFYDVGAWNTLPDGTGTAYWPGDTLTVTQNITLYAVWEPTATFAVTYVSNGGSGLFVDDCLPYGAACTVETADDIGIGHPAYAFDSWNTLPDGSGTAYRPGDAIAVTQDTTLYAQWADPE